MTGSVLVALELTDEESYDQALPKAVAFARARGEHLHLMAVVPGYGMPIVSAALPAGFEEKALRDAKAAVEAIGRAQVPDDVKWTAHVGHGDVTNEILRVTAETGASLIVMESHPPNAVRQLVIGSHAERVVHYSPVSVLVVRA